VPAKIIVKPYRGGSRVSLLGASGKELLTSSVFKEPRAKGATLRALKRLLGEGIVVEDQTLASAKAGAAKTVATTAAAAKVANVVVAATETAPETAAVTAAPKPATRRSTRTPKAKVSK
jgi:hypothetical protein